MLAPLRSAFAGQMMACDMKASLPEVSSADVAMSAEHCQQQIDLSTVEDPVEYQGNHMVKSCCNDDGACKSDCHFAITASLFMQQTQFSPALINTDVLENITNTLLVRALTPPSRPPLSLYS